jgi:hypothetical protein
MRPFLCDSTGSSAEVWSHAPAFVHVVYCSVDCTVSYCILDSNVDFTVHGGHCVMRPYGFFRLGNGDKRYLERTPYALILLAYM